MTGDKTRDSKKMDLTEFEKLQIINYRVQEHKLIQAQQIFAEAGIETILIKGWAVSRYYPEPQKRSIGDFDFTVSPQTYEAALRLVEGREFLNVDLHKGVRHLDTLRWDNLYENSNIVSCAGTNIRVLCPEDHLRVLCVHWLTDSGARKDRLWDIYYCFKSNADFDWERCLNPVSENRRRWIICTIGLAQKYLGISLAGTPFENEKIEIPNWLWKSVEKEWASGVPLKSLVYCLTNRRELFEQLKKRIPPNPIQATIESEGSFDSRTRVFYQIRNFFARMFPFLQRFKNLRWKKN